MNKDSAKDLAQSVNEFYETHGAAFGRTRGFVWAEEKLVAERIQPGMTVLDVGAGNGRFARLLPAGVTYIGFEPSSTLRESSNLPLCHSREGGNLAPTDITIHDLRDGSLPHLPIPDATADVTVCFAVFHHLTQNERKASVEELLRITKSGGLIAASAWIVPMKKTEPVEGGEQNDRWMHWRAEGAEAKRYVHLFDAAEWNALWTRSDIIIEKIGMFGKEDWTDDLQTARNWFVLARKA
ncbi:MAG: class I SAM-dependent methyltransferase [bacterium]|nr:class I SAM-dependent methyltransferase [bacterium]